MGSDDTEQAPDIFGQLLGVRLRCFRLERGYSLRQIARETGVPSNHLGDIELGRVSPTIRTLEALSKVLRVLPFDLVNVDKDDNDERALLVELLRTLSPEEFQRAKATIEAATMHGPEVTNAEPLACFGGRRPGRGRSVPGSGVRSAPRTARPRRVA